MKKMCECKGNPLAGVTLAPPCHPVNRALEKRRKLGQAKTSGTVTRDREKNWPIADQHVPVTIPETTVAHISAPVPFSFLKW